MKKETNSPQDSNSKGADEVSVGLVTRDGIKKVFSFLPYFNSTRKIYERIIGGEPMDGVMAIPHAQLSKRSAEFVDACYRAQLVQSFN